MKQWNIQLTIAWSVVLIWFLVGKLIKNFLEGGLYYGPTMTFTTIVFFIAWWIIFNLVKQVEEEAKKE